MKAYKCDRCGQYYAMGHRVAQIPITEGNSTWLVQPRVKHRISSPYPRDTTADICPACLRELFPKALATDFEKE